MGACNTVKPTKQIVSSQVESKKEEIKTSKQANTTNIPENQVQEKENEINCRFLLNNDELLFSHDFKQNTKFSEIINLIDQKFDKKGKEYDYLMCYGKAYVDLATAPNTNFKNLFNQKNKDEDQNHNQLNINIRKKGLLVAENFEKSLNEINLIGRPLSSTEQPPPNFDILVYNKSSNTLSTLTLNLNKEFKHINNFSYLSAYCNANNKIYISGGENTQNGLVNIKFNTFFSINLENGEIECLKDMPEEKSWHSMIYVPDSFIFFVGGSDSKQVFYYDIKKDSFHNESELNEERSESTLCCVNNEFLYSFFGYVNQKNYSDSIERMNFHRKSRPWEILKLKDDSRISLNSRFFAISNIEDKLILVGGCMNKNSNNEEQAFEQIEMYYIYDPLSNEVLEKKELKGFQYHFGEKYIFKSQEKSTFIILPLNEDELALKFNYKSGNVEQIEYSDDQRIEIELN